MVGSRVDVKTPGGVLRLVLCLLAALAFGACDDDDDDPVDPVPDAAVPETWGPAFDPADQGALLSVFGEAPDDIWTVGGQPEAGVAWHFDGQAWAQATLPDGPLLNWVHGAGGVLWMVGNEGRALRRVGDGAIEAVPTPVTAPLWGVWAASADEAWAVGGEARDDGTEADPVILHFTGGAWERVAIPEVDRGFRALFKVFGLGPGQVYAVGARGVALRYDGAGWAQIPTGTGEDLISLWGNSEADLAVVGGRSNGVFGRLADGGFQTQVAVGQPGFNGVFVQADGVAWVAANRGVLLQVPAGALDGTRVATGTREVLHGIWGTATGHRVAVGGSLDSSPPWVGVALEVGR